MTLIRYPGSKAKLADAILSKFPDELLVPLMLNPNVRYFEPFFGSGAVGFELMKHLHHKAHVSLSDADIGIVSLWQTVWKEPRLLERRILSYKPSVESFYELKKLDGTFTDTVDTGFRKLALHRISVSGFGAKAGGPIGGREQLGDYKVDCRWKPDRMIASIRRMNRLCNKFENLEITQRSVFESLELAGLSPLHSFVYLDPPYYEKGDQLYAISFTREQHSRLAEMLASADYDWALSYDDHPAIRELYTKNPVHFLEVVYTNAVERGPQRRKNHEILILSSKMGLQAA